MERLVRLHLIEERSSEGFQAILRIKEDGTQTNGHNTLFNTVGYLPPLPPDLKAANAAWRQTYYELTDVRGCIAPEPGVRISPKPGVTNYSNSDKSEELVKQLNLWLNEAGDRQWMSIQKMLTANGSNNPHDEIRVVLETESSELRRLPWLEWDLFKEYYQHAEIALSAPVTEILRINSLGSSVRILVAVGRSDGINTESDLEVIESLRAKGADVTCLIQPEPKELYDALRSDIGYDIFIFTGHSGSGQDGKIGWIEVSETSSLKIVDFRQALGRAIYKGLQLAIFNSCDGLGLAEQVAKLKLPQSIVMREPVPDKVAVDFLKEFFEEFTAGKSFFGSVREARERLEHWNLVYRGAQWLPSICISPSVTPPTWESLGGGSCLSDDRTPTEPPPMISTASIHQQSPIALTLIAVLVGLVAGCAITISAIFLFNKSINSPEPEPVPDQRSSQSY
ncbi:MAG: CHAT domain-containing protein [Hormoscilla sp.]